MIAIIIFWNRPYNFLYVNGPLVIFKYVQSLLAHLYVVVWGILLVVLDPSTLALCVDASNPYGLPVVGGLFYFTGILVKFSTLYPSAYPSMQG